jgi:CO/xanthine dehydrogenase Mo-binding subunit
MRLDRFASIANGVAGTSPEDGLSRRTFLSAGAAGGGGLLLSFSLPEFMTNAEAADAKGFAPNAFIRIGRDGRVTLIINQVEMGQGTYTSMPMLIAEELEVDLRKVHVEHAPPDDKLFGNPAEDVGFQMTGGSTSVRVFWEPLRRAGATARSMPVLAAARTWKMDANSCRAEEGEVIHTPTGRKLSYGALADKAATLRIPDSVPLTCRLDIDGITLAVRIAQQVDGPVKVVWTREEDIQHDVYRPYHYDRLAAGLNQDGIPVAWSHRVAGSSIVARWNPPAFKNGLDRDAAAVAKKDPVEYRRTLLDKAPRARAVLDLAAEKAGWGKPMPAGSGRGIAVVFGFGTYIAPVAEVAVSTDGEVRVSRVVCAVDCGQVVNPNTIRAQIEGGIIFGITAALYGQITIKDGRVEQTNFDSYQMLRINEAPAVEVHLIDNNEAPGGIGEPGTAAIAPAVVNAIFAATGKRLRKLPIDTEQLKSV